MKNKPLAQIPESEAPTPESGTAATRKNQANRKMFSLVRIATVGMLSALCFVLSRYVSIEAGSMKFSLAGLPILLAALAYGPTDGLLVGAVGEFLSQLTGYGLSITTPLWILPAALRGLLVGAYAKSVRFRPHPIRDAAVILVSNLLVTVLNGAVIAVDALIFGYYSKTYVFGATGWRLLASVLTGIAFCAVLPPLLRALRKAGFGRTMPNADHANR